MLKDSQDGRSRRGPNILNKAEPRDAPSLSFCMLPLASLALALCAAQEPVVLAELPEDLQLEGSRTVFAPGGTAAAVVVADGSLNDRLWRLWHDGELSEAYDFLDSLRFSRDGRHLAYRRGKVIESETQRWEVVLDGRQDGSYTWVGPPALRPDGGEVAYWAGAGVRHNPKGGVPNGVAYNATGRNGGHYFIVRGGKESKDRFPSTPERYAPVYRADGKEIAHLALLDDGLFVLVGKEEYGPYSTATGPVFAPLGKTCGWAGVPRSGRGAIVIGKKEYAEGASALGPPSFAAKGKDFAFATKRKDELVVEYDGEVIGESFGRLGKITLSDDGKHIAFVGSTSSATSSVSMSGQTIVLDDMQLIGDEENGGDRVAWSLVLDGQVISSGWNYIGQPIFSTKGDWLAVPVRKAKEWHLLTVRIEKKSVQEGLTEPFDAVGAAEFLKDGSIRFGARRGRELVQISLPLLQAE